MALYLTGTKDQALIATVVQVAGEVVQSSGGFLGRTAIQKIMYFLKALGVPMRYRFDIHHYGPYCDELSRHVEWLEADGVIRDRSPDPGRYSNYSVGDAAEELLTPHLKALEEFKPLISSIIHLLLPMKPDRLELLATLDFLYRQLGASYSSGVEKSLVIDRLLEVKGSKFSREEVSQTYDALVLAGLFSKE